VVAQQQDLDVLRPTGPAEENEPAAEPDDDQIQEPKSHNPDAERSM
jgi:hypothetical protein